MSGPAIVVVGSTGRVARACRDGLTTSAELHDVQRRFAGTDDDAFRAEVRDLLAAASVLVNFAGRAHLPRHPTQAQLADVSKVNLALPLALAEDCLAARASLVHISSSKAALPSNAYSSSKALTDATLTAEFGERFRRAGLALTVVRPPAVLAPPFDAGKLRLLSWTARLPAAVVPAVRLPAVTPIALGAIVRRAVEAALEGAVVGATTVEVGAGDRATLRDVRTAFRTVGGGS